MTIDFADAKIHHATKAKAERLAAMLEAEYPVLTIEPVLNEDESQVVGFRINHGDEELMETDKVPAIADIIEACEEAGLDPEEEESDERDYSGGIVKEKYRALYREVSSTGTNCGDWLAEWLAERTLDGEGKLDLDAFRAILTNNNVPMTGKWATPGGSRGWQGRFRMNGRQVLEKFVAKEGEVLDAAGNNHVVPADALEALRTRHATWLAKEAKREAAANEVAEAAAGK